MEFNSVHRALVTDNIYMHPMKYKETVTLRLQTILSKYHILVLLIA